MPDLPSYAVRLPAPPAGYTVPTGAVAARDSASLATLLASEVPIDIVLTGDTYDGGAGGFTNSKGHRIYAETRGSATFTSGIQLTTLSCVGAVLQGVVFDIADAAKTVMTSSVDHPEPRGQIVFVRFGASNTVIRDVVINGNRATADCGNGINWQSVGTGLTIERVQVHGLLRNGLRIDKSDRNAVLAAPLILNDIDTWDIGERTPRSENGTAEMGLWLGERAIVSRVRARDVAWSGIWTGGACDGSLLTDLDVNDVGGDGSDDTGTAIYCERWTRNTIFRRFRVGPGCKSGVMNEGEKTASGTEIAAASTNVMFEDGTIMSGWYGVVVGQGSAGGWELGSSKVTVRRTRFLNQRKCIINDHNNAGRGNMTDTSGNDYSGVHPSLAAAPIYTGNRSTLDEMAS